MTDGTASASAADTADARAPGSAAAGSAAAAAAPGPVPARRPIPLSRRKLDWILLAFFAVNLFFITYFVDIEQLTIANPAPLHLPAWPPKPFVHLVHSYGRKYDPLLLAAPRSGG